MSRKRKDASIRAVAGPEEPLWVRYAPRTAKELKVYGPTVAKVRDWLRKATSRARLEPGEPAKRLLVLSGPPGVGKSATVDALCAEELVVARRWRDVHGAGGDRFGPGLFDDRPTDFAPPRFESQMASWAAFLRGGRYAALDGSGAKTHEAHGRPSVAVLDDLPERGWGDQRAEFEAALAGVVRGGGPAILLVSENVSEKNEARLFAERLVGDAVAADPRAAFVEFNAVTELKIAERLRKIAAAERRTVDDAALVALAAAAGGDLRKAIATLELYLRGATADVAATHGGEGAVSALHAVARVCRANRGADGRLERPPDATVLNAKMGVDATAAFVQYNCVDYYGDEADLADGLATLSDADLYTARVYSTNHARDYSDPTSRGDAVFPEHYAAALVGRSVAASNRHPAPSAWRPVRKPKLYDVLQAKRARLRADPNFLHAPPRLAAACGAPALRQPAAAGDDDDAPGVRACFSDDDIDDFDDDD